MGYGQHEIVRDMVEARLGAGGKIEFEVSDTSVHDFDGRAPKIRYKKDGEVQEIACDFIAGCDGFHGICRPSVPKGVLTEYERILLLGWLGILPQCPPPSPELTHSYSQRRFAPFSMLALQATPHYLP